MSDCHVTIPHGILSILNKYYSDEEILNAVSKIKESNADTHPPSSEDEKLSSPEVAATAPVSPPVSTQESSHVNQTPAPISAPGHKKKRRK